MAPSLLRVTAGALVALLAWAGPATRLEAGLGSPQSPPPPAPGLFGSRSLNGAPISPSVVATFMTQSRGGDLDTLLIMVLWRGRPGWFARNTGQGTGSSSFSGGGSSIAVTRVGGIELRVRVERDRRQAVVQGHVVDLQSANAFLVDRVDEPDGPVIVDDFYIEAGLPSVQPVRPDHMRPLILASPDILAFLRCDVPFPSTLGMNVPTLCGQLPNR